MAEYTCKNCGEITPGKISDHPVHTHRVDCAACGRFIKWGIDAKSWKEKAIEFVLFIAEIADHRELNPDESKMICNKAKQLAGEVKSWSR